MPPQDNAPPSLTPDEVRLQRILKFIVAGLGLLILIVLGVMIVKILGGPRDEAETADPASAPASEPGPTVASFAERELRLPPGASVTDMTVGEGLLAVRYRTAAGSEEIALLDARSGEMRGRVKIIVEPQRPDAPLAE